MDFVEEKFGDYLDRFPTGFRDYIRSANNQKAFIDRIKTEYDPIKVYRFVHCCRAVFERDFLNNIEDSRIFNPKRKVKDCLDNRGVSVNESLDAMKLSFRFPNKNSHHYGIAVGEMCCKFGPATFDEDRPHHNWYLYDNCEKSVAKCFKIYIEENENEK